MLNSASMHSFMSGEVPDCPFQPFQIILEPHKGILRKGNIASLAETASVAFSNLDC